MDATATWGSRLLQALVDGGILEPATDRPGYYRLAEAKQLQLAGQAARAESRDPRFPVLRQIWEDEYRATNRREYHWGGPRDVRAIQRVLAVPPEEFRAVARKGLAAQGFYHCATVARLTSHEVWNELLGKGALAGEKHRVIAPVGNFNGVKAADYFGPRDDDG